MKLTERIDAILDTKTDPVKIEEGMILSVTKLISDAIKIPEGDYIVVVSNADNCVLIPTSEASGQTFEVFKKTLAGFFNPEVHKKTIVANNPTIVENDNVGSGSNEKRRPEGLSK